MQSVLGTEEPVASVYSFFRGEQRLIIALDLFLPKDSSKEFGIVAVFLTKASIVACGIAQAYSPSVNLRMPFSIYISGCSTILGVKQP